MYRKCAVLIPSVSRRKLTSVNFYFESFDYPINLLYQQSFFEFLCRRRSNVIRACTKCPFSAKVGGTMGLIIGASIFSFAEILFFLFYLLKIFGKHFCGL